MIDILAISTASVTSINRNVYVEMKNMGWNIQMVIPTSYPVTPTKDLACQPIRPQDPVTHLLTLKQKNPRTFYFPELKSLMEEKRPRVVIIESDPVSYMAVHVGKYCKQFNAALFCLSCENLPFDIIPTFQRRGIRSLPSSLVKKYLFFAAKKNIDTVFTINDDGTKLFKEKGFRNVVKIPLGFDPSIFSKNESQRKDIRKALNIVHPVIAYFGRAVKEKGVHILVDALQAIKDMNFHFMLDKFHVYANPYNQLIEKMIEEAGLQSKVIFIESNHYQIASYMNAADVVVLPSIATPNWKEQYGRVAPEAMACGKLVVAARSGALPELIQDGGILFSEGDTHELVRILRGYLENPDQYVEVSTRALSRAHNFLSIREQARVYSERVSAKQKEATR